MRHVNEALRDLEAAKYVDCEDESPFLFVFGVPRSGTTLLGQMVGYCLDVGYINNLIARFWLAPVTGIQLSRIILGHANPTSFCSDYAVTGGLADLHDFGYFWRHWLKKNSLSDMLRFRQIEAEIHWVGLRRVLLNMQRAFGKGIFFKNLYGAYHVERLLQLLPKSLFIYIERDPLDVATSILDARRKYYDQADLWWSVCPPEYPKLKDLSCMEQIAGQIYYLRKLYERHMAAVDARNFVRVQYADLCHSPAEVLQEIIGACREFCDCDLRVTSEPPREFEHRQYVDREKERKEFRRIFREFGWPVE